MCRGKYLIIKSMDKLFSNKQLDNAMDDLPNNGNAVSFNGKSMEEQIYIDAIYRHLRGNGIVKIQEDGGHVICVSLTDCGISTKLDGGFCGKKDEEKRILMRKFKFDVFSVIVGTILGYILGIVTLVLIK